MDFFLIFLSVQPIYKRRLAPIALNTFGVYVRLSAGDLGAVGCYYVTATLRPHARGGSFTFLGRMKPTWITQVDLFSVCAPPLQPPVSVITQKNGPVSFFLLTRLNGSAAMETLGILNTTLIFLSPAFSSCWKIMLCKNRIISHP